MIQIRFPDDDSRHRALGYLPGRFSFKSWATGEMIMPAAALFYLAMEEIRFIVWDRQMIEDIRSGKHNKILAEVDDEIKAGRLHDMS